MLTKIKNWYIRQSNGKQLFFLLLYYWIFFFGAIFLADYVWPGDERATILELFIESFFTIILFIPAMHFDKVKRLFTKKHLGANGK